MTFKRNDPRIIYWGATNSEGTVIGEGLLGRKRRAKDRFQEWKYNLLANYAFFFGCEYL